MYICGDSNVVTEGRTLDIKSEG